jgi:hypothetical protein
MGRVDAAVSGHTSANPHAPIGELMSLGRAAQFHQPVRDRRRGVDLGQHSDRRLAGAQLTG